MRTAAPETTTPESTAETLALLALASTGRTPENLVRIRGTWVDRPVTSQEDRELARAMAEYRAQAVIDNDEEVQILPGEDTICVVCEHPLPAGATGYRDKRDEDRRVRCCDCKAFEDKAAGRTVR
jgi:hypothetical protein